jgi:methionyl-tRNA formyltransferase
MVRLRRRPGRSAPGQILPQRAVPVGPRGTATDLLHRTLERFGPITVDALTERRPWSPYRMKWPHRLPVQDRTRASFFRKRAEEDARISRGTSPASQPCAVCSPSAKY